MRLSKEPVKASDRFVMKFGGSLDHLNRHQALHRFPHSNENVSLKGRAIRRAGVIAIELPDCRRLHLDDHREAAIDQVDLQQAHRKIFRYFEPAIIAAGMLAP